MRELYTIDTVTKPVIKSAVLAHTDITSADADTLLGKLELLYKNELFFPQEKTATSVFNSHTVNVLLSLFPNVSARQEAFDAFDADDYDKKVLHVGGHTDTHTTDLHSPANATTGRLTGESDGDVDINTDNEITDGNKFEQLEKWNDAKSPIGELVNSFKLVMFPYKKALQVLELDETGADYD
ncbi:MAG: hypothetical protein MJ072_00440 [Clostridia bacterium]|nr:hypothetical protein [Clostridia bacterium]